MNPRKLPSLLGQPVMKVLTPTAMAFTPLPHVMNKGLGAIESDEKLPLWARLAIGTLGTVGMASGAYHGYKRNNSVGWAIGWALLGGMFPVITIPVSLAQGFGKRKGR